MMKERNRRIRFVCRGALMLAALLATTAALAQKGDVHVIQSMKGAAAGVEIEIKSSKPFLQSDLPVLVIGDEDFTISRYPHDGELDRMIFMLTSEEFAKLKSGDKVTFQYGRGEGRNHREFGRLDKSKLDK